MWSIASAEPTVTVICNQNDIGLSSIYRVLRNKDNAAKLYEAAFYYETLFVILQIPFFFFFLFFFFLISQILLCDIKTYFVISHKTNYIKKLILWYQKITFLFYQKMITSFW